MAIDKDKIYKHWLATSKEDFPNRPFLTGLAETFVTNEYKQK